MKRLEECPEAFVAYGRSARDNYDYMDNVIEAVNRERREAGRDDALIDKASFMREFRNQYYKGSPNAIRLLYLLPPVYLSVVLWRTYKSPPALWNKLTGHKPSPDTVAQVRKSYAKDLANTLEMVGILGAGITFTVGRAAQAVGRLLSGMVIYPVASVAAPFMGWNNALRWADNTILRRIRLIDLNIPAWSGLLKLSKKAAVEASTSVNLPEAIDKVNKQLDVVALTAEPAVMPAARKARSGSLSLDTVILDTTEPKPYQPKTCVGKFHHFFGYNQLSSMTELAKKELNKTQQVTLEKLARMKRQSGDNTDANSLSDKNSEKYAELIKALPEHWQDIVIRNYVPNRLIVEVQASINSAIATCGFKFG